ncbi:hypothetical protein [Lysinibacillus xylanilyticus]|uniref:hypothetical protein n=1 Tax=Lysinibacillus xylanilyticus TaxID=582475 RepID=UPI003D081096
MFKNQIKEIVERLKYDASDRDGSNSNSRGLYQYLKDVHVDFTNDAAIGSAKQAIAQGISSLSERQLITIAIEMRNNEVYIGECPNSYCGETIDWEDMNDAIFEEQCSYCCYIEDKRKRA